MKHKGSCLCGGVRFEIDGDFHSFYLCHCDRCRKDTGSAHAANLFSNTASLHWLSGEELTRSYQLPETQHMKSFCSVCGSSLPSVQAGGKRLLVPAGSLDTDVPNRPKAHLFIAEKANWDSDLEAVPKLDTLPQR